MERDWSDTRDASITAVNLTGPNARPVRVEERVGVGGRNSGAASWLHLEKLMSNTYNF